MENNIQVKDLTINIGNKTLITNSELKIIQKQKYGLIGKNGQGKTVLLNYITENFSKHMSIFLVCQELTFDKNKTIYDIVSDANFKRVKIEEKLEKLETKIETDNDSFEKYNKLTLKLSNLDTNKDESKIRKILFGLGFDNELQSKPFSFFSGGWKMRVSIARGLYMHPDLLLLDEPTNHLDIDSTIWLTNYLKNWKKTLILVSHDVYFINEICTNIIHFQNKQLYYYNGNYDCFKRTYQQNYNKMENDWNKIQRRIKEMRNKNTKKEIVDKFLLDNQHLKPPIPYKVNIEFHKGETLKISSIINLTDVNGGYENKQLFENLNLSLQIDDKIVIVGQNGIGKSSLFKLITGEIKLDSGELKINPNVQIGYYHQHLTDILPLDKTPIDFLMQSNKELNVFQSRKYLGSMGLEGEVHTRNISTLSGGQKARIVLASINSLKPHLLLLDEPTNHLDIETIEALILAINNFKGAIIMITHNIDIIEKTNMKILKLENMILTEVDFDDYYNDVIDNVNNMSNNI